MTRHEREAREQKKELRKENCEERDREERRDKYEKSDKDQKKGESQTERDSLPETFPCVLLITLPCVPSKRP